MVSGRAGERARSGGRHLACAEAVLKRRSDKRILHSFVILGPKLPRQPSIAAKACFGGT